MIHISIPTSAGKKIEINIINSLGQVICKTSANLEPDNTVSFDLSSLEMNKGLYTIIVINGAERTAQTIIKE
jgi:hypothetical protein